MSFAVRSAFKAIGLGALGCAAAIFVACGDTNGLIPGEQASSLGSALDGVAAACQSGQVDQARAAAAQFQQDVGALSARTVDARLIRSLREGASTLEQLVSETCAEVVETVPTETVPTPETTPQTTPTIPPETTPTTPETTPTTPDVPPETTPTTPDVPPNTDPGGDEIPPNTDPGTGEPTDPGVNDGNPGGALAPGQGGTE